MMQLRVTAYQRRVARYFNSKVHEKRFKILDVVLQKVTLKIEVKEAGVLGPNWEGPYRISSIIRLGSYKLERLNGEMIK